MDVRGGEMKAEDIRIDVFSNIAVSNVRITHLPTGIVTECGEHKSQLKNREQALRSLRQRVESERWEPRYRTMPPREFVLCMIGVILLAAAFGFVLAMIVWGKP